MLTLQKSDIKVETSSCSEVLSINNSHSFKANLYKVFYNTRHRKLRYLHSVDNSSQVQEAIKQSNNNNKFTRS